MKLLSLIFSFLLIFNAQANGFLPIANIVKIKGKVLIDNQEVKEGAEIARGMSVKIPSSNDFIVIKYQNGHLAKFTGANFHVENFTEKESHINLTRGKMHVIVKDLTPGETFKIKTKFAGFDAQKSRFILNVGGTINSLFLGVCEGKVIAKHALNIKEVKKDEDYKFRGVYKKLETMPTVGPLLQGDCSSMSEFANL